MSLGATTTPITGCASAPPRASSPAPEVMRASDSSWEEPPPGRGRSTPGVGVRYERSAPAPDDITWHTYRTAHAVVQSDAPEARVRELLLHLERVHAGLAAWFAVEPLPPLEVVVYGNEVDYARRFRGSLALHVDMMLGRQVVITHFGHPPARFDELVDQALARRFVHARFGPLPDWLAEGLANYFGAARLHEDRLWVGGAPISLGIDKELRDVAPLDALFEVHDGTPDDVSEPLSRRTRSTTAWALIGYLLDEGAWGESAAGRLRAWLSMTGDRSTDAKTLRDSFVDVYSERPLDEVERGYRGYARSIAGTHRFPHFVPSPVIDTPTFARAPMPSEQLEPVLAKAQAQVHAPPPISAREVVALSRWRDNKPTHQMRLAVNWLRPKDAYGLAYGYSFVRDHSIDLEVGSTKLGFFAATRYRFDFEVDRSPNLIANLAIGPQLALKNQTLGLEPKAGVMAKAGAPSSFHHFGLSGELAGGAYFWRGFHLRGSLTVVYRVATNLDEFCPDPRFRGDETCPDASQQASDKLTGFLRIGGGYAW